MGEKEMIDVSESTTQVVTEEKNVVMTSVKPEMLEKYMNGFNSVILKLDKDIESLKDEITKIKSEIDSTSLELSNKVADIASKEKEEKERIKSSEDYTSDSLIKSAKVLEKLGEEKRNLEESLKEKINEFNKKVEELEDKKASRENIRTNVKNITSETEKTISDTISECTKKIDAINSALEVCDNEHLRQALTEEKEKMEDKLNEIRDSRLEEVNQEMDILSEDNKIIPPKEIPKFQKKPEAKENPIELSTEAQKAMEEINSKKVDELNDDKILETNIEDLKVNQQPEEKFIAKDREIIQVNDVDFDKVEQIKSSSVIRQGLASFFQIFNSGVLLTPKKKDEAGMLKTIEDDNVKNASFEDEIYIGACISSYEKVDLYSSLENLKMRFNPTRDVIINSKINAISFLEKDAVVNESKTPGTILSEFKHSSGVSDKAVDIIFELETGYILYDNPYKYAVINTEENEKKVGI